MPLQLGRRIPLVSSPSLVIAAVVVLWAGLSPKPPRGRLVVVNGKGTEIAASTGRDGSATAVTLAQSASMLADVRVLIAAEELKYCFTAQELNQI